MQFFEWTTDYQLYCRQTIKKERDSYDRFFPRRRRELQMSQTMPIRLLAEHCWDKIEGRPYYNIHPKLVGKLCKVDLNKIPSTLFQMPHGARAVNIRFAQQHDQFTVHEKMLTENSTASGIMTRGTMPAGSFCHGVLMIDNRAQALPGVGTMPRNLLFIMDFNVFTRYQQPIYTIMGLMPEDGKSIEDVLRESSKGRSDSYDEMIRNIMRLAVTIGFLADNPTICEVDVLAKDRQKFGGATETDRETIIARARRKGKNGWNIGNDMMFLGARPVGERRASRPTGRELEYAHIRGGHPHAVRYGKDKQLVKIMWYQPTTVRDDLPFKE